MSCYFRSEWRHWPWPAWGNDRSKYHNAFLAPWPNRVRDARYKWQETHYHLEATAQDNNGHALHGFLTELEGTVRDNVFQHTYRGQIKGAPFEWDSRIVCREQIEGDRYALRIDWTMDGRSPSQPMGLGWHPYFPVEVGQWSCPASTQQLVLDQTLIPTSEIRPFGAGPHGVDARSWDHAFVCDASDIATEGLRLLTPNQQWRIRFGVANSTPPKSLYFQVYRAPDHQWIALEPMTCPPDAWNQSPAHVEFVQGRSFCFWIEVDSHKLRDR